MSDKRNLVDRAYWVSDTDMLLHGPYSATGDASASLRWDSGGVSHGWWVRRYENTNVYIVVVPSYEEPTGRYVPMTGWELDEPTFNALTKPGQYDNGTGRWESVYERLGRLLTEKRMRGTSEP